MHVPCFLRDACAVVAVDLPSLHSILSSTLHLFIPEGRCGYGAVSCLKKAGGVGPRAEVARKTMQRIGTTQRVPR